MLGGDGGEDGDDARVDEAAAEVGTLDRGEHDPGFAEDLADGAVEVSLARCARRERSWASPDPTAPANRRYVGGQETYLSQCNPCDRATHVIDNNDVDALGLVR